MLIQFNFEYFDKLHKDKIVELKVKALEYEPQILRRYCPILAHRSCDHSPPGVFQAF